MKKRSILTIALLMGASFYGAYNASANGCDYLDDTFGCTGTARGQNGTSAPIVCGSATFKGAINMGKNKGSYKLGSGACGTSVGGFPCDTRVGKSCSE